MAMDIITSTQNPRIKWLSQLQQKSSLRKKEGLFVVEGQRELMHCVNAGFAIQSIYYCDEIMSAGDTCELHRSNSDVDVYGLLDAAKNIFAVSPNVYDKIAYRSGTEGVVAVVESRDLGIEDFQRRLDSLVCSSKQEDHPTPLHSPFYVVLEGVEKPGNLGAILRTADACAVDGVFICDPKTDLYNPNLIRSSIGAIFTVPCVACSSAQCIDFLKKNEIQILTAQLQDSRPYYDVDMMRPTAVVMGTEATGLTQIWRDAADVHIRIPMLGKLDSLNVSVSTAVLLFEVVRQRLG